MNLKEKIDRFHRDIQTLDMMLGSVLTDLEAREHAVKIEQEEIHRQRKQLVEKQNIILGQIEGLRTNKLGLEKKELEIKRREDNLKN